MIILNVIFHRTDTAFKCNENGRYIFFNVYARDDISYSEKMRRHRWIYRTRGIGNWKAILLFFTIRIDYRIHAMSSSLSSMHKRLLKRFLSPDKVHSSNRMHRNLYSISTILYASFMNIHIHIHIYALHFFQFFSLSFFFFYANKIVRGTNFNICEFVNEFLHELIFIDRSN